MIEAALYIALGALSISLLLFAVLPIVSGRARRLAINELERQAPVSLSEITAQKDQMRAKFAVDMNRQEKRVSKLQSETHQHQISAERWRGHAQGVEMEFDKLTDEYAGLKKKFMRLEQDLEKQKGIAKSALKSPTGKDTQVRLTLESEVDQLRAEKSTANSKIVSLQTELSKAHSRVAEMERMMPSLEELDLRIELKTLAEDVSKFVRSSPPMPRKAAKSIAEIKVEEKATKTPAAVIYDNTPTAAESIPKIVLRSQANAPKINSETTTERPEDVAKPVTPAEQAADNNTKIEKQITLVVNGVSGTNGSTPPSQLVATSTQPIELAQNPVVEEKVNGSLLNGSSSHENNVRAVPPATKLSSADTKSAKSNGRGTINFSAAKAPTKLASKPIAKTNGVVGKSAKPGKPDALSGPKKVSDTSPKNSKTQTASS